MSFLTLDLDSISVTFSSFANNEYPRTTVQPLSSVEFSVLGTPSIQGSYFEPKYMWNISAYIDREQREMLDAIAHEFHTRRRNLDDANILIYDRTATVAEKNRTRSLVPNTVETAIGGGFVVYYAVFKAAIVDGPKYSQQGRKIVATLGLTETIKVVP